MFDVDLVWLFLMRKCVKCVCEIRLGFDMYFSVFLYVLGMLSVVSCFVIVSVCVVWLWCVWYRLLISVGWVGLMCRLMMCMVCDVYVIEILMLFR